MQTIENRFYEGERPLFGEKDILLKNVKFYPGESALKEASCITMDSCEFMRNYALWHNVNSCVKNSTFTAYARAAVWYCQNFKISSSKVNAPKIFREVDGLFVQNAEFLDVPECAWYCEDVHFEDVSVQNGDYMFLNNQNVHIKNLTLNGNYTFQYTKNVEVKNSTIYGKDAFWNSENVTVYNSTIIGKYLGWYSKNLRLVNCKIGATQPLCYAKNLILEDCQMLESADLSFEYSDVNATILGEIKSVKNPMSGVIKADNIGEIIIDENCKNMGGCEIIMRK